MGSVRCEVHQLLKDDPYKRVVRIRATAFQVFQNKRCIVRIRHEDGESVYFEAIYADDDYMDRRKAKDRNLRDNDLVFMSEAFRKLLNVKLLDSVELEEIQRDSLYGVHSALSDDSNEGQIWIKPSQKAGLHKEIKDRRRIVRIKRIDAKKGKGVKPVYSEVLFADPFYLENWKEKGIEFGDDNNFIFVSAWYRRLLGIENSTEITELDIKSLHSSHLSALLYQYPRNHPQALVLGASMMGIIGFGLGVIGTGLGVVGIKDWLAANFLSPYLTNFWTPFGFVVCLFGLAITLLGIIGLIRR